MNASNRRMTGSHPMNSESEDLAKIIVGKLYPIQKKFKQISKDFDKKIEPILKKNAKYCTTIVQKKTKFIYKKIGLIK